MSDAQEAVTDNSDDDSGPAPAERQHGRAGRNLVAAVGVGAVLGAVVLATLLFVKAIFVALVVALVALAVYELAVALRPAGVRLPLIPLLPCVVALMIGAYVGSTTAMVAVLGVSAIVVSVWRMIGGREGFIRDVTASMFVVLYVPFLGSFAVLLVNPDDGHLRVICFLAVTVASDIGGYVAGVLFGRHKLAPEVSPKKSWEGLAGSAALCLAMGVVLVVVLLDGPWWVGVILGAIAPAAATMGDLFMSMLKREVGVKDMGSFLPGHGGIMDRLDSLLPMAFFSWIVLALLVPAG